MCPRMAETHSTSGERIAKRLARAGVCSRREAERLIEQGRVKVDGVTLQTPATLVTEASRIEVDGQAVAAPQRPRIWLFHKPPGLVVTARDPEGRPTVFDNLPHDMPRVVSIGRLDIASEGLLLLTNDGALARRMELPATGFDRRYRVRAHGRVDQAMLDRLAEGLSVDGVRYGPIRARLERQQRSNNWIVVTLREGKNREVRRVMEHLGLVVNRLIRIGYGPFNLEALPEGEVVEASARQVDLVMGAEGYDADGRKPGWARPAPRPHAYGRHKPSKEGEPPAPPRKPEGWRGPTRPRRALAGER
ncbi:MAG: rRNA pseudouridine synthase [Alphaproteobacteria bacterium]|nr:rRNA pseudouridine synthase [Alphaproteobacteria bacterium]MCW5742130.1 rRNA pseudouridine synthase [Alphaproteobacteria bacterium]